MIQLMIEDLVENDCSFTYRLHKNDLVSCSQVDSLNTGNYFCRFSVSPNRDSSFSPTLVLFSVIFNNKLIFAFGFKGLTQGVYKKNLFS